MSNEGVYVMDISWSPSKSKILTKKFGRVIHLENINSLDELINLICKYIIEFNEHYELESYDKYQVVIPALKRMMQYEDIIKDKVVEVDNRTYIVSDDFYTFSGHPYTDEARNYLLKFDKMDLAFDSENNNCHRHGQIQVWFKKEY